MKKVKATCAIVVNKKGDILLIKRGRKPFINHWALISGIGETLKGLPVGKAVLGEVECDLQTLFIDPKQLFILPVDNDKYINGTVVFIGKVDESKIKLNSPYSLDYKWITPSQVSKHDRLAFEHNEIVSKYLEQID